MTFDSQIVEEVSAAVHDAWMEQQRRDGNTSRISKGGEEMMVPYAALSESCKEYDRVTVRAVIGALPSLGYSLTRLRALSPVAADAGRLHEAAIGRALLKALSAKIGNGLMINSTSYEVWHVASLAVNDAQSDQSRALAALLAAPTPGGNENG